MRLNIHTMHTRLVNNKIRRREKGSSEARRSLTNRIVAVLALPLADDDMKVTDRERRSRERVRNTQSRRLQARRGVTRETQAPALLSVSGIASVELIDVAGVAMHDGAVNDWQRSDCYPRATPPHVRFAQHRPKSLT